jgi:2-oxoglutarate ferredoxin oxidoreductase subunit gamma
MVSIRFVGFGGQGVVLASTILAESANLEGKHAAQSQSYSAQVRGDVTRGDVIISQEPIVYPLVEKPDIIVAMDESALKKYWSDDALIIYDSSLIPDIRGGAKGMEATKMAVERGLYANIILLGYLIKETKVVSAESAREIIQKYPKSQENLRAFELGLQS